MQDWHPEDIKYGLRKRFGTLAKFAEDAGLSPSQVSSAIYGRTSAAVEAAIADALGVAPSEIWPSRFKDGSRILFRATNGAAAAPRSNRRAAA